MTLLARISLDALRANLAGVAADAVIDVRVDAWGHGAAVVAAAALEAGARAVLADVADHAQLRSAGVVPAHLRTEPEETVDPARVFGLDEAGSTPVMRLTGSVLSTKDLRTGEGVSYGYFSRAANDTRVALVSGGYAQGVVRALGGSASVTIDGRRCRILGRVAMDVCVVDIGGADVGRGQDAVYFGDSAQGDPTIGEWTTITGLTGAELVTAVGLHADRILA